MKIALLTEKYTPDIGGLAISVARLVRLLTSAGHQVRVYAPTASLPPSELQRQLHGTASITRFGMHKRVDDTLVEWFEIISRDHRIDPFDLLHAYFLPQAGFVAAYAGKFLNLPSVVSIRGNDIQRAVFDPAKFSHVIYALQNADAITTNARVLMQQARAFHKREITLIPNGIDMEVFKPVERNQSLLKSLGIGSLPIVGFVGELRRKKGLSLLLRGYAQSNLENPSSLLIVGDLRAGEDRQFFDKFLDRNPSVHVTTTGYVPHEDLPAYYALMDVFIHPSLRDGMPNALLEAMACERAVIATPAGGAGEILEDGSNGVLVDTRDTALLAAKIRDLLDNPEKRRNLGINARQSLSPGYAPQNELEANLKVYRTLGLKA